MIKNDASSIKHLEQQLILLKDLNEQTNSKFWEFTDLRECLSKKMSIEDVRVLNEHTFDEMKQVMDESFRE